MKTKELKKIIEECGFDFEYLGEEIFIKNNISCFGLVNTKNNTAYIEKGLPQTIAKALLDYAYTPLEEREEVKKYHLRFPKGYNSWYNYLAKEINKDNGEYDCSGKCIDNEKYKNIFTQEEIDAMPFDTNFFIKEEVV